MQSYTADNCGKESPWIQPKNAKIVHYVLWCEIVHVFGELQF